MSHQQLLPCFYILVAIFLLARLATDRSMGWRARAAYWMLAVASGVAQLYSGVYLGWFFILTFGLATVGTLAFRSGWRVLWDMVRQDLGAIATAGVVGLLFLQPFLSHYLRARRQVTIRDPTMRQMLHPYVWSWWDMGPGSWFWGWTTDRGPFRGVPSTAEHHLGIGFLTPLLCVMGLYLGWQRPICRLAALVSLLVWLATTFLPGSEIAMLATGVSFFCAAGLFHESDDPLSQGIALAALLGVLFLIPYPPRHLEALGLMMMILCVLEIVRLRGHLQAQIVPGIGLVALGLKLFFVQIIPIGVAVVAPFAGLVAYYWRSHRRDIGLGALACLLLFVSLMTWRDRPKVLIDVLVAAPLSLALSAPRPLRPPAWLMLRALLFALPLSALFFLRESLWLAYSEMIPGAIAIRAVGRVVLILLIPLALGLTCLMQWLEDRRWVVVGGILTLLCLAEQGVTTETFDAAANRAQINGVARRGRSQSGRVLLRSLR